MKWSVGVEYFRVKNDIWKKPISHRVRSLRTKGLDDKRISMMMMVMMMMMMMMMMMIAFSLHQRERMMARRWISKLESARSWKRERENVVVVGIYTENKNPPSSGLLGCKVEKR